MLDCARGPAGCELAGLDKVNVQKQSSKEHGTVGLIKKKKSLSAKHVSVSLAHQRCLVKGEEEISIIQNEGLRI